MMKKFVTTLAALGLGLSAYTVGAQAPSWSDAQREVWKAVEQSWVDDVAENDKWPDAYTHESYVAWGDDVAAPRYRDSAIKWSRFGDKASDTLIYEISPAAITVARDTAVVYYNVQMVTANSEGERDQSVGRITEVLIRDGGQWKWLGGVSFEPKLND